MHTPTLDSCASIRQIMAQSMARYATITAKGISLEYASTPYNPLPVTLITYKPARTRYIARKPVCRSLNGVKAIERNQKCAFCENAKNCTPQIALEFSYRSIPFRLLLAFTSAKNFLTLLRKLGAAGKSDEGAHIAISVIDRGSWGEACFEMA